MSILKNVKKKLRGLAKRLRLMDDFDWANYYEEEYSKQIYDLEKEYTLSLPEGNHTIVNGKVVLDGNILPLHQNHQALYEIIYDLNPDSLLEVGCGGGDHLANISQLMPKITLYGSDLSDKQLGFLYKRHPSLKNKANISIQDLTLPDYKKINVDLVFTQAVLMHIERKNYHLQALKNIFSSAKKYVVLVENWNRRDYIKEIQELMKVGDLSWSNVYFYTDSTKSALIISSEPLQKFSKVESNKELA